MIEGGGIAYIASKHAVVGMTRQYAIAYGQRGVRVNAVAPGYIDTPMTEQIGDTRALIEAATPMRRFGETDDMVSQKVGAVLQAGMKAILCVGEMLAERESGEAEIVVSRQLRGGLAQLTGGDLSHIIVAYEPVWAIGTGMTASPQQAQDVHEFIRQLIAADDADIAEAILILYGGSVKGDNAAGLFSMSDIDGGLIGGASLKADDFLAIASAAAGI